MKTTHLLFAAGDIGGARCILQVMKEAVGQGLRVSLVDHGAIGGLAGPLGSRVQRIRAEKAISGQFPSLPQMFLFSSSVKDKTALILADLLGKMGVHVVHCLDHWSNYMERVTLSDGKRVRIDLHTCIDHLQKEEMRSKGFNQGALVVTGSPAIEMLYHKLQEEIGRGTGPEGPGYLLWASEPATHDQGASPETPTFRGYTETQALRVFLEEVMEGWDDLGMDKVIIAPHPREDEKGLVSLISRAPFSTLPLEMAKRGQGRRLAARARGVAGMASMLLYEAWLMGRPVLSLQPWAKKVYFEHMEGEDGFFLCPKGEKHERARVVRDFFRYMVHRARRPTLDAFERFLPHIGAGKRVLEAGLGLLGGR